MLPFKNCNIVYFAFRIYSASMDGSVQSVFLESKVLWPTSLAIDHAAKRIYWTDLKMRTVNSALMDGARLRKQGG
jgi:hypothetical protein